MKTEFDTNRVLNEIIEKLDPNSHRKQLIDAARAFKSNWIMFGEYLTKIASEKRYLEWGYQSFEEYCKLEIRIKKNTAMKLTNAYFFVTESEPSISENFESKGVPELDVVSFLHKAKQDDNCTPEIFEDLKDAAIEKGQSGPTLARRFRQMTAPEDNNIVKQNREQSLSLIKRLQQKLNGQPDVPESFGVFLSEMSDYFNTQILAGNSTEKLPQNEFEPGISDEIAPHDIQ
ncbi:MAG: hypothetical protein HOE30_19675 [Deltaproteobacteria bacterium]|nr:hypothetical protein [Deltaproteobacteria bacterium]MBT4090712.1 hypothetical protein [Deltaproteobacteria bacterium]MBT4640649.1 hypothetical protein [Deltaproteobacteria bacterium]MBT6505076.1 hypothetical protein [Deltaproteobacteria bacterium]MBT6615166.1 hypothetical protein [Deltaproteobacteria bacterium]